jgi:hypothetical protein
MMRRVLAAMLFAVVLTSCGSGSAPGTVSSNPLSISSAGGSLAFPSTSTYNASLQYPSNNAPAGTTAGLSASTSTSTPLPGTWSSLWLNHPLVNYTIVPSSNVTFSGALTLIVNMGSNMPPRANGPGQLFIDATGFDLTDQTQTFAGEALSQNISGTTVTFNMGSASAPVSFTAQHRYFIVINYNYAAP